MNQDALFSENFEVAKFSDQEAAAVALTKLAVSATCRQLGPPKCFALALSTASKERIGPFVLSQRVAAEIRRVLTEQGF